MSEAPRRLTVGVIVMLVVFCAVSVGAAIVAARAATAVQERDAEAARADEKQATIEEVCAAWEADGGGCTPEQLKGEKGDPGPAPTPDQVYDAVAQYMSTHEVFDPALLRQFVADYLAAHPPADGMDATPITPAQLFATVATYLEANPPAAGPKGEKGDPGETPTTEELLDLLRTFLADNPDAICATGYTLTELRSVNLADGQLYEFLTCARPVG